MRPQGHERVEGPIFASEAETHWWNRKHAQRKLFSREWWQAFTPPPRDRISRLRFFPSARMSAVTASVFRRAPRGSSRPTNQLLPTIHAIVASSPSLLRVALFTAAFRGNPWIYHLATVRTERHRSISTPMIHVGTKTLRHEPLGPALAKPRNSSTHRSLPNRSRAGRRSLDLPDGPPPRHFVARPSTPPHAGPCCPMLRPRNPGPRGAGRGAVKRRSAAVLIVSMTRFACARRSANRTSTISGLRR